MKKVDVKWKDLGLADYKNVWDLQEKLLKKNVEEKIQAKKANRQAKTTNYLIFCEHPPVYTLGKSGDHANLKLSEEQLNEKKIAYYHINRGGDITYHGPGQLVVYPILDLELFFTDIHKYMRFLEQAVIETVNAYGLDGGRISGLTGVWIDYEKQLNPRKIAAFGVKTSRWVTMHGIGFNVNTDLNYFNNIIPCGIDDKAVTSMQAELNKEISMEEVRDLLTDRIAELFNMNIQLNNNII